MSILPNLRTTIDLSFGVTVLHEDDGTCTCVFHYFEDIVFTMAQEMRVFSIRAAEAKRRFLLAEDQEKAFIQAFNFAPVRRARRTPIDPVSTVDQCFIRKDT